MKINLKKVLLTGTALVAVAAFSPVRTAHAATVVNDGTASPDDTWGEDASGGNVPGTPGDAVTGDNVDLNSAALTVTNDQTATDGGGFNLFTINNIVDLGATPATDSVTITQAFNAPFVTNITGGIGVNMGGVLTITNLAAATTATTVTITNALAAGTLNVNNVANASAGGVLNLTVGTNTTIAGATAINGGAFAGASTTATFSGATDTFTGGLVLQDNLGGAVVDFNGGAAQVVNGTIDGNGPGQGTLTVANTVGGTTFANNIGGIAALGTINLNAATATSFTGTVDANTIAFGAVNTTTFNGNVDATDVGGTINFAGHAGTVVLASGINDGGAIDDLTSADNGILTLNGAAGHTIGGNVGGTNALATVNLNGTGANVVNGTVDANAINFGAVNTTTFNNNVNAVSGGTIDFVGHNGTVVLADTVNIGGALDNTGAAGNGNLTLNGATGHTITGNVGGTHALSQITLAGGGTTNFTGTVNSNTILYTGADTANFAHTVTTDAIDFGGVAGIANFADGANVVGDIIDSSGTNHGTVNFAGTSTVTPVGAELGSLGTAGSGIAAVNTTGALGKTVTVAGTIVATNVGINGTGALTANGNVTATTINFGADGVFNVGPAVTTVAGNITTSGASTGTLNIGSTAATEFTGTVGTVGGLNLKAVNLTGAAGVVTFDQNVAADTFAFTAANEVARLRGNLTTTTGAGTITGTGTQSFAINGNDSTITNSGAITAIAGINVNSGNTLTLAGAGAVTGGTILLNANNAVLTVSGAKTVSSTITGAAGTQTINATNNVTLSGPITLVEALTVDAGHTLTLSGGVDVGGGAAGVVTITGAGGSQVTVTSDVNAAINGGAGGDTLAVNGGGTVEGAVTMGAGNDTLSLGGGTLGSTVDMGGGADTLILTASSAVSHAITNLETANIGAGHTLTLSAAITGVNAGSGAGFDTNNGTIVVNTGGSIGGDIHDSNGAGHGQLTFTGAANNTAFSAGGLVEDVALTVNRGVLATNGHTFGAGGAGLVLGGITVGDGVGGDTARFNVNDNVTSGGALTLANNGTVDIAANKTLTVANIAAPPAGSDFIFDLNKTGAVLTNGAIATTGGGASVLTNATITMNITGQSILGGEVFHLITGTSALTLPVPAFAGVDTSFVYNYALSSPGAGAMDLTVTVNPSLASDTTSSNNLKVADVLLQDLAGSTNPQIIEIQNNLANATNKTTFNNILSSVQPTVDGSGEVAAIDISGFTFDLADQRLYSLRTGNDETGMLAGDSSQGMDAWAQAFGQHANQDARDGINGYDSNTWGGAAGFDTRNISDRFVVGIAGSYGRTTASSSNLNHTATDVDSYQATLYGTYDIDRTTYVDGMAAYGWDKDTTTRLDVGGVNGLTAHGSFNAKQITAQADAGRDFDVEHGTVLTPNILAHWVNYAPDSYTETGAGGADMRVDGKTLNLFELGAGLNAGWTIKQENGSLFKPQLRAGYRYAVVDDRIEDTSTFTGGGGAFTTQGATPDRSRVDLGASLKLETTYNWDLTASYDFNWRSDYTSSSGFLRAGYKF